MEKRRAGAEEVMSPVPDPPQAEEPQPTRHASTASLSLEWLPDDVLLLVLQYLDVPSLLTCRLVCKWLGALALHQDVWRHREVGGYERDRYCVCPELRLAPCVRIMCFYADLNDALPCRLAAYVWTRCAAAELRMTLDDDAASTYAAAAALISRQETLGRLRSLTFYFATKKAAVISSLLGTVASTPGLENLDVRFCVLYIPATIPLSLDCTIPAPSLRQFTCCLCPAMEPFVNFVLARHAATLETVDVSGGSSSMNCGTTGPLLAGLPKLAELSCCNIPGVEAVAARDTLRKLELTVRTETEHRGAVAEAASMLRRASQLREVEVIYSPGTPDVCVDVVRALASSGRACVESLEIRNPDDDEDGQYFCHLQELITAMPLMQALRRLQVDVGSVEKMDKLALAITPATAPTLRTIHLGFGEGPCGHAWLHRDAFKTLMSKNPLLHLGFDAHPYYCDDESCQACVQGCHEFVKEYTRFFTGHLFCHDFDYNYPQEHSVESRNFQWVLS